MIFMYLGYLVGEAIEFFTKKDLTHIEYYSNVEYFGMFGVLIGVIFLVRFLYFEIRR